MNEIGNLSFPLQAKLLSVIEQRKSSRLGSTTSYPVDVRLICATNTDLYTAIDNGQFRQDLLYRINTIEIRIPPLRERGNDLFLLADFFLQRYRKKYKKELRGISREARKMLQLYRWPGNVRELEHAIERAVILSTGTMLTPDDFMLRSPRSSNTVSEKDKYNLERMEKDAINEVMRMCGGNITLAAEMLGITRTSLLWKKKLENISSFPAFKNEIPFSNSSAVLCILGNVVQCHFPLCCHLRRFNLKSGRT